MTRISLTETAHKYIAKRLQPGDIAIDATMGNGFDTVFLAQQVAINGLVYAFDIQRAALAATREKLESNQLDKQVKLYHKCHATMIDSIDPAHHGNIKAVMFNLGYLPGSDKTLVSQTATTLQALETALTLLAHQAIISIIAYPGHASGEQECLTIKNRLAELNATQYKTQTIFTGSKKTTAPELYFIIKHCT